MGKVIGINGREVNAEPQAEWATMTCETCGWPHFRWLIDDDDTTHQRLECGACTTTYTFRLQVKDEEGSNESGD